MEFKIDLLYFMLQGILIIFKRISWVHFIYNHFSVGGRGWVVRPGGKILLNCLELLFVRINQLNVILPLTRDICFFLNPIVPTFSLKGGNHFILLSSQLHIVHNLGRWGGGHLRLGKPSKFCRFF